MIKYIFFLLYTPDWLRVLMDNNGSCKRVGAFRDFSDSLHLHQLGYSVNKRKVEDLMNVNVFVEVD